MDSDLDSTSAHECVRTHASVTLPDAPTLLKAKIKMAINRLMATYLSNLEELADEHDEAMGKLIDALPVEHKASVRLADIYGEARFAAIRKHVLKAGNNEERDLSELIEFLRLPTGDGAGE